MTKTEAKQNLRKFLTSKEYAQAIALADAWGIELVYLATGAAPIPVLPVKRFTDDVLGDCVAHLCPYTRKKSYSVTHVASGLSIYTDPDTPTAIGAIAGATRRLHSISKEKKLRALDNATTTHRERKEQAA